MSAQSYKTELLGLIVLGLGFNVNADGEPDVRPKFCFISFEKYRLGLNSSEPLRHYHQTRLFLHPGQQNIIFCLPKKFSVLSLDPLTFRYRSWKRFQRLFIVSLKTQYFLNYSSYRGGALGNL